MLEFTIYGNLPRKSNSRRIIKCRGIIRIIKSEQALQYEKDFAKQVIRKYKIGMGNKEEPIALRAEIYYQSGKSDLSDELLCDLLEKNNIISNDRYIKEKHLFGFIDKKNPRVEVKLWKI